MIRSRNPFPGVSTKPDRHGKLRHRLRRTVGGRRVDSYLPGPYGSPEFRAAYEEEIEGVRLATRRAQPGTFSHLIEAYLDSAAFRNLAPTTRLDKRPRLDWIRTAIGDARYARMQPRQVEALMTKKGGPAASNKLKKDLAQLFRFAAKHFAFSSPNPASLADSFKIRSSGFHSWTDEEIASFRDQFPSGSQARLALELFLGTGAARQDTAGMTRANIRGAEIHYSRQKTGQDVVIPILPELALELARIPPTRLPLLAHGRPERPYTAPALGGLFRRWCIEAGLPDHCRSHGLRKGGARRLAEAGATEFQIMSFLGHKSPTEAARYTAAANRTKLAASGVAMLRAIPRTELSNLSERLDNEGM